MFLHVLEASRSNGSKNQKLSSAPLKTITFYVADQARIMRNPVDEVKKILLDSILGQQEN